jgi:hypothetical protein
MGGSSSKIAQAASKAPRAYPTTASSAVRAQKPSAPSTQPPAPELQAASETQSTQTELRPQGQFSSAVYDSCTD